MTAEATRPEPLWVHSRQARRNLAFSFSFSISSISFPRVARPLFERSTHVILDMPLPVPPQRREMRSCLLAVCVEDLPNFMEIYRETDGLLM